MPRRCSVCVHRERAAIETALSTTLPVREIESLFGLSRSALSRHHLGHMAAPPTGLGEATQDNGKPENRLLTGSAESLAPTTDPQNRKMARPLRTAEEQRIEQASCFAENSEKAAIPESAAGANRDGAGNSVKRYRSRWRGLQIGDRIRFRDGVFETADPELQALIESRDYFGAGVVEEPA